MKCKIKLIWIKLKEKGEGFWLNPLLIFGMIKLKYGFQGGYAGLSSGILGRWEEMLIDKRNNENSFVSTGLYIHTVTRLLICMDDSLLLWLVLLNSIAFQWFAEIPCNRYECMQAWMFPGTVPRFRLYGANHYYLAITY